MFYFPGVVDTQVICELQLLQSVMIQLSLAVLSPGPWELQFVEYAKLHASFSLWIAGRMALIESQFLLGKIAYQV